jgi:hypothetical protein
VTRKYFIFGFFIRLCVGSDIDVDAGFLFALAEHREAWESWSDS